jgi:hypothetical protein
MLPSRGPRVQARAPRRALRAGRRLACVSSGHPSLHLHLVSPDVFVMMLAH